jgi:hypothetical protein
VLRLRILQLSRRPHLRYAMCELSSFIFCASAPTLSLEPSIDQGPDVARKFKGDRHESLELLRLAVRAPNVIMNVRKRLSVYPVY